MHMIYGDTWTDAFECYIYIYMNMWGLMHMIYGDTCVHV